MKSKVSFFLEIALWIITALSIVINFNHFLMGGPTVLDLIVTVIFVAIWFFVILFGSGRKNRIAMTVWSLITLITAMISVPIAVFRLDGVFLAPLAMLFFTPYNGLAYIAQGKWVVVYMIMILISGSLTVIGLIRSFDKTEK